jgi:hypothetical protein
MLTIENIIAIGQAHGLEIRLQYPAQSCEAGIAPKASEIRVTFPRSDFKPDAWFELVSNTTEIPVNIQGTRQVSGSGSIDGSLYPVYAERLQEANVLRSNCGLSPLFR